MQHMPLLALYANLGKHPRVSMQGWVQLGTPCVELLLRCLVLWQLQRQS